MRVIGKAGHTKATVAKRVIPNDIAIMFSGAIAASAPATMETIIPTINRSRRKETAWINVLVLYTSHKYFCPRATEFNG